MTEKVEGLARAAATQIAVISQDSIGEWGKEIRVLKNIPIHGAAIAGLILESILFGQYYVGEKLKVELDPKDRKNFDESMREMLIFMLTVVLHSEDEGTDRDAHKEKITEMYDTFAPEKLQVYANYKGNTIVDLYKTYIKDIFNRSDFKIKFFENTFSNRLRLNVAGTLSNSDSKFKDDVFLDQAVLFVLADSIFTQFAALNYQQLNELAETIHV